MNKSSINFEFPSLFGIDENDISGFKTFVFDEEKRVVENKLINPINFAQDILNIASSKASELYVTKSSFEDLINELNLQLNAINSNFESVSTFLGLEIA